MLRTITPENRHRNEDLYEAMMVMRDDVVRNLWNWRVPDTTPGDDRDRFDRPDTIYLLYTDEDLGGEGRILATTRLNPTVEDHMLTSVFRRNVEPGREVRESTAFEWSRYIVDHRHPEFRKAMGRLGVCLTEACVAAGVRKLTWLATMPAYGMAKKTWPTMSMGLPVHYEDDDQDYVAAVSEMTTEAADTISARHGFTDGDRERFRAAGRPLADALVARMEKLRMPVRAA